VLLSLRLSLPFSLVSFFLFLGFSFPGHFLVSKVVAELPSVLFPSFSSLLAFEIIRSMVFYLKLSFLVFSFMCLSGDFHAMIISPRTNPLAGVSSSDFS